MKRLKLRAMALSLLLAIGMNVMAGGIHVSLAKR